MEKFAKVSESRFTGAIVKDFCKESLKIVRTDVAIIGAGPDGLMAARDLAKESSRVIIVEANNFLGGGCVKKEE